MTRSRTPAFHRRQVSWTTALDAAVDVLDAHTTARKAPVRRFLRVRERPPSRLPRRHDDVHLVARERSVVYRRAVRGCPSRRQSAIWASSAASKGRTKCCNSSTVRLVKSSPSVGRDWRSANRTLPITMAAVSLEAQDTTNRDNSNHYDYVVTYGNISLPIGLNSVRSTGLWHDYADG
jgi:hypothetical protein